MKHPDQPIDFRHMPDSALLRRRQMLAPLGPVPLSSSSLSRFLKEGRFPAPITVGQMMVCWRWGDVRQWLEAQTRQEAA